MPSDVSPLSFSLPAPNKHTFVRVPFRSRSSLNISFLEAVTLYAPSPQIPFVEPYVEGPITTVPGPSRGGQPGMMKSFA